MVEAEMSNDEPEWLPSDYEEDAFPVWKVPYVDPGLSKICRFCHDVVLYCKCMLGDDDD